MYSQYISYEQEYKNFHGNYLIHRYIFSALIFANPLNAQPRQPSACVQQFDVGFRKCFNDLVNLNLEAIFYLVTNGNGGKLTSQQQTNIEQIKQNVCG